MSRMSWRISIRLSAALRRHVETQAAAAGVNATTYVRQLIARDALSGGEYQVLLRMVRALSEHVYGEAQTREIERMAREMERNDD